MASRKSGNSRWKAAARGSANGIRRPCRGADVGEDRLGRGGLMRLWRLSSLRRAREFDGGYGLTNSGRWNTTGRPVTYCSTVPSLTALEKRVHVTDTNLLPPQAMVEYAAPDDVPVHNVSFGQLPNDWALRETHTQTLGDAWLDECTELILVVP